MRKRSPEPITINNCRVASEAVRSPTSPLERNPRSPGWKKRDSDGVGLGIVVALEKSNTYIDNSPKLVLNFHRVSSPPIPISPTASSGSRCGAEGSTRKSCTSGVFCCGGHSKKNSDSDTFEDLGWDDGRDGSGFFCASPPRFSDEFSGFPMAGFLNSCYLCRKKLDGKDIYMYRGEKAFCSMECRYRQIVADEYQESCGYEASRPSVEIGSSGYSGPRLFYTGIMAA